jgi:hypothetical protein
MRRVTALDEIAPEDWSNLLAHADAIDFFTRPDPAWRHWKPVFHLTITDGERSRELAKRPVRGAGTGLPHTADAPCHAGPAGADA